jgi:hypothetical protein
MPGSIDESGFVDDTGEIVSHEAVAKFVRMAAVGGNVE